MTKVVLYIAQSLDGYIADKEGGVGWLDQYNDPKEDYGYHAFYESVDTLIMGANTYRQILTFGKWPYTNRKSYVISHQKLDQPKKANIEFYSGDLAKLVEQIKTESKKDIWLVGGAKLLSSFMQAKLVDEWIIFVMPTLLGEGIPLFQYLSQVIQLNLLDTKKYDTGVVELRYNRQQNSAYTPSL